MEGLNLLNKLNLPLVASMDSTVVNRQKINKLLIINFVAKNATYRKIHSVWPRHGNYIVIKKNRKIAKALKKSFTSPVVFRCVRDIFIDCCLIETNRSRIRGPETPIAMHDDDNIVDNTIYELFSQSERLRNVLEMDRLRRSMTPVKTEPKIWKQYQEQQADEQKLIDYVYAEKARRTAEKMRQIAEDELRAENRVNINDGGDAGDPDEGRRSRSSNHTTWSNPKSVASPIRSREEEDNLEQDNDDGDDTDSVTDRSRESVADESFHNAKAVDEEDIGQEDKSW